MVETIPPPSSAQPPSTEFPPGFHLRHTLSGHQGKVGSLAWSPGGKRLATPSDDRTVKLWDPETGAEIRTLKGDNMAVLSVAWSPDGALLASGSYKGIRLWDPATGESPGSLQGHSDFVLTLHWSPDGRRLASGSSDKTVIIWDTQLREAVNILEGHSDFILSVAWSPGGRQLASGSLRTIRLWNAETGIQARALTGHEGAILSLVWLPDGSHILSGSGDNTIRLWNLETGRTERVLEGHGSRVTSISLSADGRLLASKSDDSTVRLWSTRTWETLATLSEPTTQSFEPALAFHPSKPLLAVPTEGDTIVRLWDIDSAFLLGEKSAPSVTHYLRAKAVVLGPAGLLSVPAAASSPESPSASAPQVRLLNKEEVSLEPGCIAACETHLWDLSDGGYEAWQLALHLGDSAVLILLFDPADEAAPEALGQTLRQLDAAEHSSPPIRLLAALPVKEGADPEVVQKNIQAAHDACLLDSCLQLPAGDAERLETLREAVAGELEWAELPGRAEAPLYEAVRSFLDADRESGQIPLGAEETFYLRFIASPEAPQATRPAFTACLRQLEKAGALVRLHLADLVLLRPELLDSYVARIIRIAHQQPEGHPFLLEEELFPTYFAPAKERPLSRPSDERALIEALPAELAERGVALRQHTGQGPVLIFPGEQAPAGLSVHPGGYALSVVFRFEGSLRRIYATLVARLTYATAFSSRRFYRNAALFNDVQGRLCGFMVEKLEGPENASAWLTVFFGPDTGRSSKLLFLRYVSAQIKRYAVHESIERERLYYSSEADILIPSDYVQMRRERGESSVLCPVTGEAYPLDDLLEDAVPALPEATSGA